MMDLNIDNNKAFKMIKQNQHTICMSLVHEAIAPAKARGIDLEVILKQSNISAAELDVANARVCVQTYGDLWIHLAEAMQDEFFGLDATPLRRGSFQYLSKALIYCETIHQALEQILNFFNVMFTELKAQLVIENDFAKIVIQDAALPKSMFAYATYWMLVHSLMCWLSGQRIRLAFMHVKNTITTAHLDYQTRFCDDIRYQTHENALAFAKDYLNIAIKQDAQSCQLFLKNTPYNLLVRFKNPSAFSQKIRQQLLASSPHEWLDASRLAHYLHMSEATLQRRLRAEGLSYQQLKNSIRRDLAIDLLGHTAYSLQEISERLNFHDPSAFHRAFKKWTGFNPSYYRKKH